MNDPKIGTSISTRPVTSDDHEFLFEVYQSSRGDDLRGLGWEQARVIEFLRMQYEAHQQFHDREFKNATDEIILVGGERAGRLVIERREHEIRWIDLSLLPQFQNSGVGSFLIRKIQDDARRTRKPLRLQIIRFNRAVNLFERLGFVRTSETGTHFQLEWTP